MRKDFGPQTWTLPMPVLMIGTFDGEGKPDVMNAAWGGTYDENKIVVSLSADHKTTRNIREKGAFSVSFADTAHLVAADYVGIVSANDVDDKIAAAGLHAEPCSKVDAPRFAEFPLTLECKLVGINGDGSVVGDVVNVSADPGILGADGKPDLDKLALIVFDPIHAEYRAVGGKVGNAFRDGAQLNK